MSNLDDDLKKVHLHIYVLKSTTKLVEDIKKYVQKSAGPMRASRGTAVDLAVAEYHQKHVAGHEEV